MTIVFRLFFIVVFLSISLFSQVNIINENINASSYTLKIRIEPHQYEIKSLNGKNLLHFSDEVAEFTNSNLVLPGRDIFIAIPQGSKPSVSITPVKSNIISAEPELKPVAEAVNDSVIKYSKREIPGKFPGKNSFEIKGYLWLGSNYVMHLQLNQYNYDYDRHVVIENEEYEIRLNFNNGIPLAKSGSSENVDPAVLNKTLASGLLSRPDFKITSNDEWIDYNKTYLKLGVAQDAIYRLYINDLTSAGVLVNSIDPRTFTLINKGVQVPIFVSGEGDGQFNESDFIEFPGIRNMGGKHREVSLPGEPYNEYLGRYTDTTIYWLTWGGDAGQRVQVSNSSQSTSDTLVYYHQVIHSERNEWFDFSIEEISRQMPFWYENKTWGEGYLQVGTSNRNFTVSDVYPNSRVKLFSKQQSYAWGDNPNQNVHLLALSLNSLSLQDSGFIKKYEQKVLYAEYNSNLLNNGTNTLRIHSFPNGWSSPINICFYDWWEVEYPRYLKAVGDSLNFFFPYVNGSTLHSAKITNLSTNSFSLWKYGSNYKKFTVSRDGTDLLISDNIKADDKFILSSTEKIKTPKIYYIKQFDNLKSASRQADYIAVTHKLFKPKVLEYSQFIASSYNVTTAVIDVEDIYDQYSYGYFNPEVIKDFLQTTHASWQDPLPKYVALIGGATYDYHSNKVKFQSLSPVLNYVPSFGVSVSDNWFVTWDTTGAYIPQMNIGRIPARTIQEFEYYFSKHQAYIQQEYDEWNKSFLFFSGGNNTDEGQINQLRGINDFVLNNYVKPAPVGGNAAHFYKTVNPPTSFGPFTPQEIQSAISKGGAFISYIGHSGTQTWDNTITQPSQLKNNKNKSPLITDFGCSTARFAEPDILSFSQLFLLDPQGQAIAYIGNSSLGYLTTSTTFPQIFYRKLLVDSVYNISEALKTGKTEMIQRFGSSQVYQLFALTNTLLGDPIVSLAVPGKSNLQITTAGISSAVEKPTDNMDSITFKINYFNLGRALPDTFNVKVEDVWGDSLVFSQNFRIFLPLFSDSLFVSVPVMKRAGGHLLKIILDSNNELDEIKESDNEVNYSFNVSSSSLRTLFSYSHEQSLTNELVLLNPSQTSSGNMLEVEFSRFADFSNPVNITHSLDTFFTRINLDSFDPGRLWLRAKISGESTFNQEQSFSISNFMGYNLNDALSFETASLQNLKINNSIINLDTSSIALSAMSAGFNDGNTALITKDGENLIPENTLRGHHLCLLNAETYEFEKYELFDILGGNPSETTEYINFLDTLSDKHIVIIAISSNAAVSNATLKQQIKSLGSVYIDSLVGFGSWAIIGRKGAAPGTVPEAYSRASQGRVEIDTTILLPWLNGNLLTSVIGPSSEWESLHINQNLAEGSDIKYRALGIKRDGAVDTLDYLSFQNSVASLNFIDSRIHPNLKILSEFSAGAGGVSPLLLSLGVTYKAVPELGTNYQAVSISKDSLVAGDSLNLDFSVFNAGKSAADSFNVSVSIIKPDNSRQVIYNSLVVKLDTLSGNRFSSKYVTGKEWGNYAFAINIDSGNNIPELYEDNNSYEIPFYVKQDTNFTSVTSATVTVKFDGVEILDGDFTSPSPRIEMELKYPTWFPVDDTTAVEFFLDAVRINYSQLEINYDTVNKRIVYYYKPALSDGEHLLRIFGKNVLGNIEDNAGFEKIFSVTNEMEILNVYTYPNPFAEKTDFTFKLTQIPDELKIKIYTIAGRLIREISIPQPELKIDYNTFPWDGKDEDGDQIANGVYLYKIIMKRGSETKDITQKLARLK